MRSTDNLSEYKKNYILSYLLIQIISFLIYQMIAQLFVEMSHRSAEFEAIVKNVQDLLTELM